MGLSISIDTGSLLFQAPTYKLPSPAYRWKRCETGQINSCFFTKKAFNEYMKIARTESPNHKSSSLTHQLWLSRYQGSRDQAWNLYKWKKNSIKKNKISNQRPWKCVTKGLRTCPRVRCSEGFGKKGSGEVFPETHHGKKCGLPKGSRRWLPVQQNRFQNGLETESIGYGYTIDKVSEQGRQRVVRK